ncbi:hypothetical protein BH09BAC2_BH09BAC2_15720 [soil metagenome]
MRIKDYLQNKPLRIYLLKFALAFCFLYFGTLAVIGISAPGGLYNSFIAQHLNYIDWLRSALLHVSKIVVNIFGFKSRIFNDYVLGIPEGHSVRMVYKCVGYGVMSFWGAFIFANNITWQRKILWILSGWLMIFIINVIRIAALVIAVNTNTKLPVAIDHHTIFNIVAYALIFCMIWIFDKKTTAKVHAN